MLKVIVQKLPNNQLVLTIPKDLAEIKGWDKGTVLSFKNHDQNSVLLIKENVKKKK